MSARVNCGVARIPVCVGVEVGIVALCNLVRDTREFQDALLQSRDVLRIWSRSGISPNCARYIVEAAGALGTVEENGRHKRIASEESTAIIVDVKAEVKACAECVRSVRPRDVIDDLWRRYGSLCVRGNAVWEVDIQ